MNFELNNLLPIIRKYKTPLWCINLDKIKSNISILRTNYPTLKIGYVAKTLGFKRIIPELSNLFDSYTAVSLDEVNNLISSGIETSKIIWWGAGRDTSLLKAGIQKGVGKIIFDSELELKNFFKIKHLLKNNGSIGLRIQSNNIENNYCRFGININESVQIIKNLLKVVEHPIGIAFHGEINCNNIQEWIDNRKNILIKFDEIITKRKDFWFDLGGGLSSIRLFKQNMNNFIDLIKYGNIDSYISIGRAIVNDAGFVITKIIDKKQTGNKEWLIVDVGSNLLLPLTHSNYKSLAFKRGLNKKYNIGDPYTSYGLIQEGANLPNSIQVGDLLLIKNTGAYTWSLQTNKIWKNSNAIIFNDNMNILYNEEGGKI